MEYKLNTITIGMELPEISKVLTQGDINRYAKVSSDFNPIHIDEKYAAATPLGGTIAHGMYILAFISQMMTSAFGVDWIKNGKLSIRFKSPARPGDTIKTTGKITGIDNTGASSTIKCDVVCINQKNESVIVGETQVTIAN